ncbi:MAG: VCBS repeat-containing protein [Armatimonadetes bacterium]|nr:VCBS repeat-containing protein [Armatimonadota bacterium]
MKIASSQLSLASQHVAVSFTSISESATLWIGQPPNGTGPTTEPRRDRLDLSDAGAGQVQSSAEQPEEWQTSDPKYALVKLLLERLFGATFDWLNPSDFTELDPEAQRSQDDLRQVAAEQQGTATDEPEGWGLTVTRDYQHAEAEAVRFRAQGQVVTADGQSLRFSVDMGLSREYAIRAQQELRFGDDARVRDPLVLNYAGHAAELTDRTFEFDLDADGTRDRISFTTAGSAFLAVDRNQNGRIDDGSELFGPATGDGWAELAASDDDHNGWIDENDAAFDQLRLWTRDDQGQDHLTGLLAANVGAIALASTATPFTYTTAANETLGQSRSAGIFLHEDGSGAGTVQQIDLVA